ncbi:TetR family transcriptional regulator [Actinophytocola sp.]|uniref:acyl-CoA-like ligand-binding transcription factor n=1 Tax=Actinophytocola sp. TaxID=1872138 RepID=UPI002ED2AD2C
MAEDGLRERKKRETRIALSWAAIRLFVERGFENVRVEDIAAEVGVSPRTFNNYFSSKAAAVVERHVDRARLIADELRARPADEPLWEAITAAVLTRFAMGAEITGGDQKWLEGVRLLVAEPALQLEFMRVNVIAEAELAEAIAERTGTDVRRDLYPKLVASMAMAATETASAHWQQLDSPTDIGTLLADALRQVAAGLPTP